MRMVNFIKSIGFSEKDSYDYKPNGTTSTKSSSFEDLLKNSSSVKNDSSSNASLNKTYNDNKDDINDREQDTINDNEDDSNKLSDSKNLSVKKDDSSKETKADKKVSKEEDKDDNKSSDKDNEDDLSKVENDLKALLKDASGNSNSDSQNILQLLMSALKNSNFDITKLNDALNKSSISKDAKDNILKFVSDIKDALKNNSPEKIISMLKSNFKENLNSLDHKDFISKIVDALKEKVNENQSSSDTSKLQNMNLSKNFVNDKTNNNKMDENINNDKKLYSNEELKGENYEPQISIDKKSSEFSNTSDGKTSEGDSGKSFLKNLVDSNSKTDNNMSKLEVFMNQFSQSSSNVEAAAAEKVTTLNKATFVQDVIKSVKFMENNNMKELTVKINPKELGEVIIRLTSENGAMKAELTASNKDAYALLNSNLNSMNENLNNQNIKIQSFSLNMYNEDTTFFAGQGGNKDGNDSGRQNDSRHRKNNMSIEADEDTLQSSSQSSMLNNLNALA